MSATAAAAISAAFMVASSVSGAINNYGEAKRAEKLNKYNARVVDEDIKSLNYEEAMNMTLRRLNAYSEIGSGKAVMAGRGNIGTSADAAVMNAYRNLAGDLSTMSFNYAGKRRTLETEKQNYLYQAKIAKAQKKSAIWGGVLSAGGSAVKGYSNYKMAGGSLFSSRTVTDVNGNVLGRVGGYGSGA